MRVALEMPAVAECTVVECTYNQERQCHAKAITVGDMAQPECDTFFGSQMKTHDAIANAGVGACKAAACQFNEDFECTAPQILVAHAEGHASCLTFMPKS